MTVELMLLLLPFSAFTLAYLEFARPGAGFGRFAAGDEAAGCVEELAAED